MKTTQHQPPIAEPMTPELVAAAPALLEALEGFEAAFDKWYCDSGHLCALLDALKTESATTEMKDEVIRLQNLVVMSIKARAAIAKAKGQQ